MSRTKDLIMDQMENEYNVYCKKREMNDMNRLNDNIQNFIQKYIKYNKDKNRGRYLVSILCDFCFKDFAKWFSNSEHNNRYAYRVVSSYDFDVNIVKSNFISFNNLIPEEVRAHFCKIGIVAYPKNMDFLEYIQKEFEYFYKDECPCLVFTELKNAM
jgi:hypothetical protein